MYSITLIGSSQLKIIDKGFIFIFALLHTVLFVGGIHMSGVSGSCGAGRGPVSLTHRQDAAILQRYNADLGRQSLGEPLSIMSIQ